MCSVRLKEIIPFPISNQYVPLGKDTGPLPWEYFSVLGVA